MSCERCGREDTFHSVLRIAGRQGVLREHVRRFGYRRARGGDDLDLVVARSEAGEADIALAVRCAGFASWRAGTVEQVDGNAGQVGFAAVLRVVGILVGIDMRGESGGGEDTLHRVLRVAGRQRVLRQDVRRFRHRRTRRGDDLDLVIARRQTSEADIALAIRRAGLASRRALAVEQVHRHAGQIGFAAILRVVGVLVGINVSCERCGGEDTLHSVLRVARRQRVLRQDIRRFRDRRARRGDDLDLVIARRQAREADIPLAVRRAGLTRRRTLAVEQVDGHAGQVSLAAVLRVVGILVGIDMRGERCGREHTFDSVLRIARRQRVLRQDVGHFGHRRTRRCDDLDLVIARRQAGEADIALAVRRSGLAGWRPLAVEQVDRDAGQIRLAAVLRVVGILVGIDVRCECGGGEDALNRVLRVARRQRVLRQHVRRFRDRRARRGYHLDVVVSRRQGLEADVTATVRGAGLTGRRACAVEQVDRDARQVGLAAILRVVGVLIEVDMRGEDRGGVDALDRVLRIAGRQRVLRQHVGKFADRRAARLYDLNLIIAWGEAGKAHIAAAVRGPGFARRVAVPVQQQHRDTGQIGLATVLCLVGVLVGVDMGNEGRGGEDAFDRILRVARRQGVLRENVRRFGNGRARRRYHLDLIVARRQAGEADIAAGVRRAGLTRRDTRAVEQVDGDARQIGFAAILRLVGIFVGVDMRGEGRGGEDALDRVLRVARRQRVFGQDVRRLGDRCAGRRDNLDLVIARRQACEADVAAGVRCAGLACRDTRAVEQVDRHAGQIGFAAVLRLVRVLVGIDMRGKGRGGEDALDRVLRVARRQRVLRQDVRRFADRCAGRRHHLDLVIARRQAGEADVAAGVGRARLACRDTRAVEQVDRHTGQIGLTAVLGLVRVLVGVDVGRESRGGVNAFDRVLRISRRQRVLGQDIRRFADRCAGRRDNLDLVVARRQAGEADIAAGVGRAGLTRRDTRAVEQVHGHAGQIGFAAVLRLVGVLVRVDVRGEGRGGEDTLDRILRIARRQRVLRQDVGRFPDCRAGRRHDLDLVIARRQAGEADISAGVRRTGLTRRDTRAVEQVDRHARQIGLAAVLRLVGVLVGVDVRGEGRGGVNTLDRARGSARSQGILGQDIRGLRHSRAGRSHNLDLVVARRQPRETDITAGIRRAGLARRHPGPIKQIDGDARQIRLAAILRAVRVLVGIDMRRKARRRNNRDRVIVGYRNRCTCGGSHRGFDVTTGRADERVRKSQQSKVDIAGSTIRAQAGGDRCGGLRGTIIKFRRNNRHARRNGRTFRDRKRRGTKVRHQEIAIGDLRAGR